MKDKIRQKLEILLEEGKSFNFSNFAMISLMGYPESYSSEYISWRTRVSTIIEKAFGQSSAVYQNYQKGGEVRVLGYPSSNFNKAHAYFLGAIRSGIDLMDLGIGNDEEKTAPSTASLGKEVFIVHGHDEKLKQQVEIFLKERGLTPIVLHRQPDEGRTVIEKFEKHSKVGYAIILLTPDDIGYSSAEGIKEENERKINFRARQNVIFEFGYFVGKLGRGRVCCIFKEGVDLPTDVSGMIYKSVKDNVEEVGLSIMKDLKAVGYSIAI